MSVVHDALGRYWFAGAEKHWHFALGILSVLMVACSERRDISDSQIDRRVLMLMECVECTEGERDTVISMGEGAVPSLREALINGPNTRRVRVLDSSLRARLVPRLSDTVIGYQLRSFRSMYTRRSADALGAIGGAAAEAALCAAGSTVALTGFERQRVDSALARAGGTCQ